jgi:hypothetical protein
VAEISTGGVKATLNDVDSYKNSDGVVLSGGAGTFLSARNVIANQNTGFGFSAAGGSQMDIINSQASYNATGIDANGGGTVIRCSRSTVSRNTTNGLGLSGGLIQSYGNMEVSANVGNNGPFSAGGPVLQ